MAEDEKKKDSGLSDAFSGALVSLLPAVVGGLFAGKRGAVVGADVGIKAGAQFAAATARQRQSEQEQARFEQGLLMKKKAVQQSQAFQRSQTASSQAFQSIQKDLGRKSAEKIAANKFQNQKDLVKFKAGIEKQEKLSESQAKARKFARNAEEAQRLYLEAVTGRPAIPAKDGRPAVPAFEGFDPTGKSATVQELGTFLLPKTLEGLGQTEGFSKTRVAEEAFVEAAVRDSSGAAIPLSERQEAMNILFARPGNSPSVVKSKNALRANMLKTLKEKGLIAVWDNKAKKITGFTKDNSTSGISGQIMTLRDGRKVRIK